MTCCALIDPSPLPYNNFSCRYALANALLFLPRQSWGLCAVDQALLSASREQECFAARSKDRPTSRQSIAAFQLATGPARERRDQQVAALSWAMLRRQFYHALPNRSKRPVKPPPPCPVPPAAHPSTACSFPNRTSAPGYRYALQRATRPPAASPRRRDPPPARAGPTATPP